MYSFRALRRLLPLPAALGLGLLALPATLVAQGDQADPGPEIAWEDGPEAGDLGGEAKITVPDNCIFTGAEGAKQFLEITENPTSGLERGVMLCRTGTDSVAVEDANEWWVLFSFDPSGYVKDDEKDELDADAILESIREGTEQANEEREKRGWGRFDVVGWVQQPFYDPATNNLTWSIDGKDQEERHTINHSVRLLGRGGVMSVDLIADPEQMASAVPAFNSAIAGFTFKPGHKYSEWREGDKIATYGLTALVAGGVGAAAMKSGLLGKLWKVIAAGVIAIGAGIRRLFGRKGEQAA